MLFALVLLASPATDARQRPASTEEMARAEKEGPRLAAELGLTPGMAVADLGAGYGAMMVAMARLVGPQGQVYATDVGAEQLAALRALVEKQQVTNVIVRDGAPSSTNLPVDCCDAIFLRDVYHHLTEPDAFNKSLRASLKPGGRLAVIDFLPRPNSSVPDGVPANRVGHGVPIEVVAQELTAAGFTRLKTTERWPPDSDKSTFFLVLFEKR